MNDLIVVHINYAKRVRERTRKITSYLEKKKNNKFVREQEKKTQVNTITNTWLLCSAKVTNIFYCALQESIYIHRVKNNGIIVRCT